MFNFNTTKRQPNLNSVVKGAEENDASVNTKALEIDSQRREFEKKNPEFNMKAEMENKDFVNYILKNGLSVEDAYFLTHRDEIIKGAAEQAVNRLNIRRDRIAENGAGKNSPASVRKNPKDMSDKEIDSIIERVRNGEKISF